MNGWCEHCDKSATHKISGGYGFFEVCRDHYNFFITLPAYYGEGVEE